MKKLLLYVSILIISLLLASCFPTSEDLHETEEWSCLINSDGTGFEWLMRGNIRADFTEDSQKIVYDNSEGIFTRDFEGNIEQISSVSYHNYDYFSDDLQYLIDEDDNDIFRMDIDGTNRINLTNTPESRNYDSHISSDGTCITYISKVDTVYSIWIMDINGENKEKVITDSLNTLFRPILNIMDNKIYYIYQISYLEKDSTDRQLKSINRDGSANEILIEDVYIDFKISNTGNVLAFTIEENSTLQTYSVSSGEVNTVGERCHGIFDIDYFGEKLVWLYGGETIKLLNLNTTEHFEIERGYYPSISHNGEKIFFIKDRELPVED